MSAIVYDARINAEQLQKDIANINANINKISSNMRKEGQQIDAITSRIGQRLAGAFSIFSAGMFVKDIAKVRGEFQQLEVAFETMLGSKERADKLFAQVVDFAQKTPFQLTEVAAGTKQLLAYGIAAEDILPTLKSLGDVSAGLSVPIERLILNYGQVRTQLHLTGRELRDFNLAGVPLIAELAKNLNVAEKDIASLVERQKITFEQVKEAFRSMTDEGGRFNNLMDKQAKTIAGLASNFKDAFDEMLNSIGTANQDIIAGSIKGAMRLVENYEEVIKILKLLIVTYGTYKAAVIAMAVAERASVMAGNIRAWFELARGIRTAKDAQIAFNLATKANPYALIATAIASLISYLVIFRKETKDTQDYIDDLNDSIESIGKQIEVDNLITRYVDLQNNTKRTKTEQEELNKTVKELGAIFPGVITQTDKYGNAIGLAKDKLIELNDELRENSKLTTEKKLLDSQDLLNRKIEERKKLLDEANSGLRYATDLEVVSGKARTRYDKVGMTVDEIEERREKVEELNSEINKLTESVLESEDKLQSLGQIDATKALQPYKKLFGEVEKYSEDQALKIKEELTKLLFLGLGSDAEKQIKAEIDKIASQLALPTIQDQIKQIVIDLKTAQGQLDNMRAPGSRASDQQINDKEDEIKALQEKYDALTGINRKEAEKYLEKERKIREEKIKAISAFNDLEISLEMQLQASKVAIMQQGVERRRAEAELEYRQELERIRQQQQEYIIAWNKTQGFEPGDSGFVGELPQEEIEQFNKLRVSAEIKNNQQIETINRETAKEIKAIWKDVNDVYLSDSERNIQAINDKYDGLIEQAKKVGETDLASINEARARAIEESMVDSGLKLLQFEEEIEMQRAEISTQGFNREVEIEKKKLEIVKKFAQQKIDILKKSDTEESKNEIKQLELYIQSADIGLKELNKKTLSESIDKISEMASAMKEFSNEVFGADSQVASLFNELSNGSKILANIASGNYIGAAAGLLQTISGWYQQTVISAEELTQAERETREEIFRINDLYRERLQLLVALGLMSPTEAAIKDVDLLNKKLDESKKSLDSYQQGFLLNNKQTFATIKEIFDVVYGKNWGAYELNEAMKDWDDFFQTYLQIIGGEAYKNHPLSAFNWIYDKEQFNEYLNDVLKYSDEIEAVNENLHKKLTNTTAEAISDSIIEGFKNGYNSAADFANDFEGFMRDAMINALAVQYLEGPIKLWQTQFANFMQDGIIDPEERRKLQEGFYDSAGNWVQGWNQMIDVVDSAAEVVKNTTGIDLFKGVETKPEGLTGAIRGITEETAGLIAGQFMAMREIGYKTYITGIEQLDVMNQSVTHLARIEENTSYNKHLVEIRDDIKTMNVYIKNAI